MRAVLPSSACSCATLSATHRDSLRTAALNPLVRTGLLGR